MADHSGARHGLRYDINLSLLFTELPVLRRPEAARAAGFDAIEFWWPFEVAVPGDAEVDAFVSAVTDAGVALVGLNFFAGDMPGGDRGLVSWVGREPEFRDSVDVALGIARRLGCRTFNALYGNRVDGVEPAEQDELALSTLDQLAGAVAELDGQVVLEPLSAAPRYPLRTAADALAVIDKVGRPNVTLLADLYHLAVNGDDLASVIAEHTGRIGHVQIADAPGRGEPGSGELDLDGHLAALQAAGYGGFVGLEYKPTTDSESSLGWLPRARRAARAEEARRAQS
ncbi:hydroxypyruvate isomerase family protein [Prauserella muralis]|uniref:Hydroxypyruvate isomerase n=1 Tax=Prauserella muralis TaxID=588067 RepID=A0A2V4AYS1_9PSEU|nr:TIM barrel protein [Prauserella muralis]PXY27120.1 hydroxypyruvate isomerase [Prauserella muralis]TWE23243.1 hydroxypyruvate isomerase [Prauserella muralis]